MSDTIKAREVATRTVAERQQKFLLLAKQVHGYRYDYSLVEYVNSVTSVTIVCPDHGSFQQKPNNHTSGKQGCPECGLAIKKQMGKARRLDTTQFIEKSAAAHGHKYDYSQTTYVSGDKPVTVICKEHGEFVVARAEKHYLNLQGCPHCVAPTSVAEDIIASVLDELGEPYHREYTFDDCRSPYSGRKLRYDFYLPTKNLLLEYHGEQHFRASPMMHKGNRFAQMQHHDVIKAQYAVSTNIHFVTFTYKDAQSLRKLVKGLL